jgi:Tat protein secretion system quality control protein TatD with DNase activity
VKEVARQIGELRGLSPDEIGAQTSENFYRFFHLPESAGGSSDR